MAKKNVKSKKRLIHLHRFNNARLTHVSMDGTKPTETVTFSYIDLRINLTKLQTRWCYYDPKIWRDMLQRAIEQNIRVDLLVQRFIKKVPEKQQDGATKKNDVVEDWIADVKLKG